MTSMCFVVTRKITQFLGQVFGTVAWMLLGIPHSTSKCLGLNPGSGLKARFLLTCN